MCVIWVYREYRQELPASQKESFIQHLSISFPSPAAKLYLLGVEANDNMAVRIGRWDCTTCGHVGVLGPETTCPNCGASRPRDVRFYLPSDAEEVTDRAVIQQARAGADWICGHCSTQNKIQDSACKSCGNPKDEESQDVALTETEYAPGQAPKSSATRKRTLHPEENGPKPRKKRRVILPVILLILAIGIGGAIPTTVDVKVDGFQWERSIQMLHKEAVPHEEWSTPAGAFDVSSFRAVHHYDQVFRGYETRTRTERVQTGTRRVVCGTIDRGNGYFEDRYCDEPIYESRQVEYQEKVYDQVPVYRTKYRYKLWEWVARNEYKLSSSGQDHEPFWPDKSRYDRDNDVKEGDRREQYAVVVTRKNGSQHLEAISADQWSGLEYGSVLTGSSAWLWGMWYGLK